MESKDTALPIEQIQEKIYLVRGEKVLLDIDLAKFYAVDTRTLIQAIKRNRARFPSDFMFQLSNQEVANLRSQLVISSSWGGRRYRPYAFTEQGIAMLAGVLKSTPAILVHIRIVRSFSKLRKILATHEALSRRTRKLEETTDHQARAIISIIRELEKPTDPPKKHKLGF